ncbi:MAG: hypothetical protein VKJ06_03340 [Vampirovibrionales bacterium]|nr:hypothetical protein [Vampirovibrionales bacterium]
MNELTSNRANFSDGLGISTGLTSQKQLNKQQTVSSTVGNVFGALAGNLATQGAVGLASQKLLPKKMRLPAAAVAGAGSAVFTALSEAGRANADGKIEGKELQNIVTQSAINGVSVAVSVALGSKMAGKSRLSALGIGALDAGLGATGNILGNGVNNIAHGERFDKGIGQAAVLGTAGSVVGYGIGKVLQSKSTVNGHKALETFYKHFPEFNPANAEQVVDPKHDLMHQLAGAYPKSVKGEMFVDLFQKMIEYKVQFGRLEPFEQFYQDLGNVYTLAPEETLTAKANHWRGIYQREPTKRSSIYHITHPDELKAYYNEAQRRIKALEPENPGLFSPNIMHNNIEDKDLEAFLNALKIPEKIATFNDYFGND